MPAARPIEDECSPVPGAAAQPFLAGGGDHRRREGKVRLRGRLCRAPPRRERLDRRGSRDEGRPTGSARGAFRLAAPHAWGSPGSS